MLIELSEVLEIISSYNEREIADISFSDIYFYDEMIEKIKKLDPNYELKPILPDPDPFGDNHCLRISRLMPDGTVETVDGLKNAHKLEE